MRNTMANLWHPFRSRIWERGDTCSNFFMRWILNGWLTGLP
ncbi:hypothetical protein Gorai_007287, partial [Gossypium raimondii]|nr:hypothetical protein [Gossypium raimondii]